MSAPVPDATGDQGGALDLDAMDEMYHRGFQPTMDEGKALVAEVRRLRAERGQVRAETWADIAAVLNDRAQMWQDDNRRSLAEECRGMANACRTYAEGVGTPSIDSLRRKRREAEAEVRRLRAMLRDLPTGF